MVAVKSPVCAHFSSTHTKVGMIQRGLSWSLSKEDTHICEDSSETLLVILQYIVAIITPEISRNQTWLSYSTFNSLTWTGAPSIIFF